MRPIPAQKFRKVLKRLGLEHKGTQASHEKWDMRKPPMLDRPVIIWANEKDIPILHVKTNLHTLGMT